MDQVLFLVAAVLVVFSSAAPLDTIEVTVIDHDDIQESNGGSLVYTDHGTVIIGDMEIDLNRNAVLNPSHRWPQGQVYYTISQNYSSTIHNTIIAAMRELEHNVNGAAQCIKFVPRTNQANYIEIHAGTGCHSIVGYNNHGKQEVSIGVGCELKGIIMHELIHSLGFWHEHNRPDRDTFIDININNVKTESRHDFNLRTTAEATTLRTSYDFGSIMHYGTYTFALDRTKPVVTPNLVKLIATQVLKCFFLRVSPVHYFRRPQITQRLYNSSNELCCQCVTLPKCMSTVALSKRFENTLCGMVTESTPTFT
ncbi:Zinc metalloproteinase nas-15 [Bulinus truncatus]|nr:Zinc metalloproteinase nas-15 [Bulinus truncatus]